MAAIALATLLIAMLPYMRQWFYELLLTSHLILGVFAAIAIWLHLRGRLGFDRICLLVSVGLFLLNSIIYIIRQIFRNFVIGEPFAIADIMKHKDAVEITFRPPRPWKVQAGQYVYIRAPGVRLLSFAESHPYSIIWWENGPDDKAVSISVLAKVESGFTKALSASPYTRLRVLIDGPYGEHKDIQSYSSILMVAAGIGIAAQLSYVKEMVGQLRTSEIPIHHKRISLVWQLDEEYHQDWVCNWMDKLLDEDSKTMALVYSLYVLNNTDVSSRDGNRVRVGRRGAIFYGKPDLRVSAEPKIRDELRSLAVGSTQWVDFYEPDYQPRRARGGFWAPQRKVRHFGVA
ncbi:hypothetical protein DTO063F5_3814 [Paecilomyces variotii]|nr:hypothetical protein DTO063F5_3814 [Paecilomyces variotii]